jgi:hypothetical protein
MPAAPEPTPPAPEPVITGTTPTTVKTSKSTRESLQQASSGTSALTIPLSTGGMPTASPVLTIGGK